MGKSRKTQIKVQLHCFYYNMTFQKMQPQILLISTTNCAFRKNIAP